MILLSLYLVMVVYKRFPYKSLRTAAVMLMSSVWHGVYAGYYLSLLSVPFCLFVSSVSSLTQTFL